MNLSNAGPRRLALAGSRGRAPGLASFPARQSGFTLIEMVVVLVVLAFALSIVASRGPMRSRTLEARLAASRIAEQLRLARTQAIATDRTISFTLDIPARAWRVGAGAAHLVPEGTTLSMLSVGQMAGSPAPARRAGTISFAPDGSSSGGRIELADGGRRMSVSVDWLTGRVAVAETQ